MQLGGNKSSRDTFFCSLTRKISCDVTWNNRVDIWDLKFGYFVEKVVNQCAVIRWWWTRSVEITLYQQTWRGFLLFTKCQWHSHTPTGSLDKPYKCFLNQKRGENFIESHWNRGKLVKTMSRKLYFAVLEQSDTQAKDVIIVSLAWVTQSANANPKDCDYDLKHNDIVKVLL